MEMYNRLLREHELSNVTLVFRQDNADLKSEILKELGKQNASISEKDLTINKLQHELDRYRINAPRFD